MRQADPRYVVQEHRVEFKPRCSQCMDTGAVLAREKEHGGAPYAFRCNCEAGHSSRRAYPPISLASPKHYEVIK